MATAAHRPHRWLAAVAAVVLAALSACSFGAPGEPRLPPAESHTVSGEDLATVIDDLFANDYNDAYRNRRALLVTVDGRTVLERYHKSSAATTVNSQSVGKTIMATLIGIALDEGHLQSPDQTLPELLPSYRSSMTPEGMRISLRHLLTMTAGLPSDDDPRAVEITQDWVSRILASGPTRPPGDAFAYSSAGSHLLSVILSEATGRSTLDYAREKLFTPLGIDTTPAAEPVASPENLGVYERAAFAWPTDPEGHHIGGGGVKLTAVDMAKLGELWLGMGRWRGRRLVSAEWMAQAQQEHVPTDSDQATGYGYQQWVLTSDGHTAFAAIGYAGQLIEWVPDKGLVVVVQSASPADPSATAEPGTADTLSYMGLVQSLITPVIR
jgi:CubicO group peptidase (beta-lactamase class C family)